MARIIISYDDTDNDRDALALGRALASETDVVSLAYVRHARLDDPAAEAAEEHRAHDLLQRGARTLGRAETLVHVIVDPSTADGLRALAEREAADLLVFGSDYRTAPGAVRPGTAASRLLDGGPVAVAVAPAGLAADPDARLTTVGVLGEADADVERAARTLAFAIGATLASPSDGTPDLVIVGSSPAAPIGRLQLSAAAEHALESARGPVVALPRGATLEREQRPLATA